MFKKVVTEEYPEEKRPTAPRYHGRHVLNRHPDGLELGVGRELWAWACPADALYVGGAALAAPEWRGPRPGRGRGGSAGGRLGSGSTRSNTFAGMDADCAYDPAR